MTYASILPPNSTPLERALEASFAARLAALPVPVGQMMNPATCPAAFLPWLAWALSVDDWDAGWSEAQKRTVIAASVAVHRRKGTIASVKQAMAAMGYGDVVITEGRQTMVGGDWAVGNSNYWVGAANVGGAANWPASITMNGISSTKVGYGEEGGIPYVDVRFQGTATGSVLHGVIDTILSRVPAITGQPYTASAILRRIGGSATGITANAMRIVMYEETAPGTHLAVTYGNGVIATSDTVASVSRTIASGNQIRLTIDLNFTNGAAIDVTYRIKGAQLEPGPQRTSLEPGLKVGAGAQHWAEYWLTITQAITPAEVAKIHQRMAQVAPARCKLTRIIVDAVTTVTGGPWVVGDPAMTVGATYEMEINNGIAA